MEEEFVLLLPVLHRAADRTAVRYGMRRDDARAEAYYLFVEAYTAGRTGDLRRGRLNRIVNPLRREARRSAILARSDAACDDLPGGYAVPRTADLGADAAAVATMAMRFVRIEPRRARGLVRRHFLRQWDAARYERAVEEIREVLGA